MEAPVVESPFVGLVPYTEQDARFFFGRDREQRLIIANLFASRLTILYGASGVGKSSVLRAGVVTGIEKRAAQEQASGEPPRASVVYFRNWQGEILPRLGEALQADAAQAGPAGNGGPPDDLLKLLETAAGRAGRDLLLILDQFEEYFLYHPQDQGENSFARQLAKAANASLLPANFLISLRDDALSRLDRFKPLIPNLFSNYLRLDPLSGDEARSAITEPLAAYKRLPAGQRAEGAPLEIEAELVNAVIAQVPAGRAILSDGGQGATPAARPQGVEAPYLQLVMQRLWREELEQGSGRIRLATLNELKGAEEIVKRHLDEALEGIGGEEREICARMFQFLVTESGAKVAHTAPDLASYAKVPVERLQSLLEQLAGKVRILAPVAPPSDRPDLLRYEIYHDSLGRAVLDWRRRYVGAQEETQRHAEEQRLQREVDTAKALADSERTAAKQARALALEQKALAEAQKARAETEERAAAEERRAKRRLRWALAALAAFFLLAVGLAILAVNQRRQFAVQTTYIATLQASLATPVKRGPEVNGAAGKYVLIHASTFLMGCSLGDTECFDQEKPTHKVTLTHDFYMAETDVTVGAYRKYTMETHRAGPPSPFFKQTEDDPVVNVSWQDAADYCKWDGGGSLPTEAEWEYAARAGTSQSRYGNLDDIAWYDKNAGNGTRPVRQKQPNGFGLYDMLGNVWQWTADWYDDKYYQKSPAQDPPGAASAGDRSVRGGSWFSNPGSVRVSSRNGVRPGVRCYGVGLRCVREVP